MNALRIFLVLTTFISTSNLFASEYKGDYLKITGDWTALNEKWCGGSARVACNDGRNCEIQIRRSKCAIAQAYLKQNGDIFKVVDGTYKTTLIQTPSLFNHDLFSGNIYIDLRRALTDDAGLDTNWKTYWINMVLTDGRNTYEKISPNFKARF